jgi:hypothetical protein
MRNNKVRIGEDDIIRKSQHGNSKVLKLPRASPIVISRFLIEMLPAIQFNRQFLFQAAKVDNESCNRNLPPELKSADLTITKACPETLLCVCRFVSHHSCETAKAPGWISIGSHGFFEYETEPSP